MKDLRRVAMSDEPCAASSYKICNVCTNGACNNKCNGKSTKCKKCQRRAKKARYKTNTACRKGLSSAAI